MRIIFMSMQGITICRYELFPHIIFSSSKGLRSSSLCPMERMQSTPISSGIPNVSRTKSSAGSSIAPNRPPHLYPAASQTEVGGLQLHENGSDRSILDPCIGEGHVGGDDDSERSSGNGFGSRSLAFGQTGERFFVFHRNELPRSAAFGRRSEQSRFENGFTASGDSASWVYLRILRL